MSLSIRRTWIGRAVPVCSGLGVFIVLYALAASADPISYDKTMKAAEAHEQQAVKDGCAWSVTEVALKNAATLYQQGHKDQALLAAGDARMYAELSLQQCDQQKTEWKQAVVR